MRGDHDTATLRGQAFGAQLVLSICVAKICELMPEPDKFLDDLQKLLIPAMKQDATAFAPDRHREDFEQAAIGAVGQIAEGARGLLLNSRRKMDA